MAHVIRNAYLVKRIKATPLKSVIDVKHSTYLDQSGESIFEGRYFLGGICRGLNLKEWDLIMGRVADGESIRMLRDGSLVANAFLLSVSSKGKYFYGSWGDYQRRAAIKLDAVKIYPKKKESRFYDEGAELLTKTEMHEAALEVVATFLNTIMYYDEEFFNGEENV